MAPVSLKTGSLSLAAAALAVAAFGPVRSAVELHAAVRVTELEASVLDEDIRFVESKLENDPYNYVLSGHAAELYARRFQANANLADVDRAEALARAAIGTHPDPARARARLSRLLLTQHRFQEAFQEAQAAVADGGPDDASFEALAAAALGVGAYAVADSAIASLSTASIARRAHEAADLSRRGRHTTALRRLRESCDRIRSRALSRDVQAWCIARLADLRLGSSPADARRWLGKALAVRPGHRGATEQLADLAQASGDYKEARRLFEDLLTPAHPDLYLRLAEVNLALGDEHAAAAYEDKFVQLASAPGMESLSGLELGRFLAAGGRDCARAIELADRELVRRRSVEALLGAAEILGSCDRADQASRYLREAEGTGRL